MLEGYALSSLFQSNDNRLRATAPMVPTVEAGAAMPQDSHAEAAVLAAMLISADVLEEGLSFLQEDDFYIPSHQLIFMSMRELHDTGRPVDSISLADNLMSKKELERVGGRAYLVDLASNTPALASWQYHSEILRRNATLREIIKTSSQITALAFSAPEDTKEVVNDAEQMLLGVTNRAIRSTYSGISDVMEELFEELDEQSKHQTDALGVKTGFPGIDKALLGMRAGQMVVIGARPGVGKTSFCLNLAVNAAASGASVALFSLEMSKKEIAQRLLSAQAKINLQDIRSANIQDHQWAQIVQATSEISSLDIMIDDTPGTTITEIRAKARRMLHGKENGIVIIDYLQLVSPPSNGRRSDSRATEVSEMSRGIKIMAKDLEVPVVALSQLNRQVADRKGQRPQLSDLRESGSIEQDADIVILLDRSMTEEEASREDRPDANVTDFIIAKNRSGPLGIVHLVFMPGSTKFVELSRDYE